MNPLPRQEHADRALARADREHIKWSDVAYGYLCNYAKSRPELFTGEDVTETSKQWGLVQPSNSRAWGSLFRKAQREGVIVRVDNEGRRYNGNATPRYRRAM